jgi:perosamine synthetase
MLGVEEIAALTQVIESGTLTSTRGSFTKRFEQGFAKMIGAKYGYACASGSAAVHIGVACVDPEPGDEIITTSITDMGALSPIVYQGAIPVFCDVNPKTCNVTAEAIEKVISEKTKAIIVTHLFGNPCDMHDIMELARARNIAVIEDCAQAFLAKYRDEYVGTLGDIAAFSLQQGKHITTGEGGIVVTNNADYARRAFLYINKAWGYGDEQPDHYFLALNYRMCELQGAVAHAQLGKLQGIVAARGRTAAQMTRLIEGVPGIEAPQTTRDSTHVYWKYCLRVDSNIIPDGAVGLASALREKGIASAPRYIQKPAFRCQVFRDQVTFGKSRFPFTLARPEAVDYDDARFPGTLEALEGVLVLPWNERYTDEHVNYIATSVRESVAALTMAGITV